MHRTIGVVSGKGGVGKTVTSINVALALHQFGEDVVVVDSDTTVSNIGLHLGFYKFPNELQDVLKGEIDVRRAIYSHHTGLKLIPSSINIDSINTDSSNLHIALNQLEGITIVDAPPGLDKDSRSVLEVCDDLIIVTNLDVPTVTNALKVARVAHEMKKNVLGIVVNRMMGEAWELSIPEVEVMCELPVVGIIPEDPRVRQSIFEKTPVVAYSPYSASSLGFKTLAARLIGKTYDPPRFLALKKLLGII